MLPPPPCGRRREKCVRGSGYADGVAFGIWGAKTIIQVGRHDHAARCTARSAGWRDVQRPSDVAISPRRKRAIARLRAVFTRVGLLRPRRESQLKRFPLAPGIEARQGRDRPCGLGLREPGARLSRAGAITRTKFVTESLGWLHQKLNFLR